MLLVVGRELGLDLHGREGVACADGFTEEFGHGLLDELREVAFVVNVAVEQTPATAQVVQVRLRESRDYQLAHVVLRPLVHLEAIGDAARVVVKLLRGADARAQVALARVSLLHRRQALLDLEAVGYLARLHAERDVELLRAERGVLFPSGLVPDVYRALVNVHRDADAALAIARAVGLRFRRREGCAQVAALVVEREQVALDEAGDVSERVLVVEDAAGLLHQSLFGDGARADVSNLADAEARPLDSEHVLDLTPRRVERVEAVLDRALDLALAQEVFERLPDLLCDGPGFGRGAVEGWDFAPDRLLQLLVREPDEVVEGDGHAPGLLDDREGDDGLVGLAMNLVTQILEEAGLQKAVRRRVNVVERDALPRLQAALLKRLRLFDLLKPFELYAVELQSLRRALLLLRKAGHAQRDEDQRGGEQPARDRRRYPALRD